MKYIFLLLTFLFSWVCLHCDEETFFDNLYDMEEIAINDINNQTGFSLPKNPTKAAFLSAFIPGSGQFYNEKYLKSAAVVVTQASLVGLSIHFDKQMSKYKKRRDNSTGVDNVNYHIRYIEYYELRQSYRFWVGASVLLSALDAYVDAHLFNFNDKKNEIRLKFEDDKLILSVIF
jgi:TM2 domain-containing membrane protein YozV